METIDLGLSSKRAIVAGAGYIPSRAGNGRHTTLQLARAGARLACVDIDPDRAHAIVAEVTAEGGEAYPIVADMTDAEQVARALREAIVVLGGIDVCVDIIGGATWNKLEDVTTREWQWSIDNNLTHVFLLFQAVARQMISQGTGGSLVALASVDATVASAYHGPYGAAKAGIVSLAKTFAYEFGRYGIRANVVAPGNVGTGNDDQPEGVWAVDDRVPLVAPRAIDIANGVLFLSSALAARVTGHTLVVDGGNTIRQAWSVTPDTLDEYRWSGPDLS